LVANSEKSFSGFNPGLEKPLNISFKTNRRGKAVAIEFQTGEGVRKSSDEDKTDLICFVFQRVLYEAV
jgi:hypothetical protein